MKVNTRPESLRTHEGGKAKRIGPKAELRRSVLSCMLWEDTFYESGVDIAERIKDLVPKVEPEDVASLAIEARTKGNLRHIPLLLVREMCRHATHKGLVGKTLPQVIQRADELTEFVAIYWKDGRRPLSAQALKGLRSAFRKFDAYALAKYDRDGAVKLRDVLFLCHAKPRNAEQDELWKKLINKELETPDTWEVAISACGNDSVKKRAEWKRLLGEGKLGAMALLRNLRNMTDVDVDTDLIRSALNSMDAKRVLPFRFISAARVVPQLEPDIERAFLSHFAEEGGKTLGGTTLILVDVSGSMDSAISSRSTVLREDAGSGLAMIAREICDRVRVFTFSNNTVEVPARRGFALRDAIRSSQPHSSTLLGDAVRNVSKLTHDRIIVITDEQAHDVTPDPVVDRAYLINVASYQNGVGYGPWTHIDGFSDSTLEFIVEYEKEF